MLWSFLPWKSNYSATKQKMKYTFTIFLLLVFKAGFSQKVKKTKLYIIGTVHESSEILNPRMLFDILDVIKPDILLQENDTEQIANYFKEIRPNSNEQGASLLYLKKYWKNFSFLI